MAPHIRMQHRESHRVSFPYCASAGALAGAAVLNVRIPGRMPRACARHALSCIFLSLATPLERSRYFPATSEFPTEVPTHIG